MLANISSSGKTEDQISRILSVIGQPARIQILMVISKQEACVCHFEAVLGMRQASISQHLMVLRKAGLVSTIRDGRNIFYHLQNPDIIPLLLQAARLSGNNPDSMDNLACRPVTGCPCPQCNPEADSDISCQNLHPKKNRKSFLRE
jgi:ArsR family transcriptional regulator